VDKASLEFALEELGALLTAAPGNVIEITHSTSTALRENG
jgi:hypothetical protein